MCDLSVLSGIIPRDLVYTHKYDINYKIDKYKEDDSDIYYNCYIKEVYSRDFEFIFNKKTKEIEIINQVSGKCPIFRKMTLEYTDKIYNIVSDMYIIDKYYISKVYHKEYFIDPYFRFSLTKSGISIAVLMDYIFREQNGIHVKVKMPTDYYFE